MFGPGFPAKRGTCSTNAKEIRMKVTVENDFRAEKSWYSNDFIWLSCGFLFHRLDFVLYILYIYIFLHMSQDTLSYTTYTSVCALYGESGSQFLGLRLVVLAVLLCCLANK